MVHTLDEPAFFEPTLPHILIDFRIRPNIDNHAHHIWRIMDDGAPRYEIPYADWCHFQLIQHDEAVPRFEARTRLLATDLTL